MLEHVVYEVETWQAERFFEYAGYRARNMREPLARARSALLHHINMTFATEGAWALELWPPLSKSWERVKAAHGVLGRGMLVFTGQMRRQAISESATRIVGGDALIYRLDHPFAAAHQYGGWTDQAGREHPPARPFVVVTEELVEDIERGFLDWLDELRSMNVRRRAMPTLDPFRS